MEKYLGIRVDYDSAPHRPILTSPRSLISLDVTFLDSGDVSEDGRETSDDYGDR